jgi:hypothetical protein
MQCLGSKKYHITYSDSWRGIDALELDFNDIGYTATDDINLFKEDMSSKNFTAIDFIESIIKGCDFTINEI